MFRYSTQFWPFTSSLYYDVDMYDYYSKLYNNLFTPLLVMLQGAPIKMGIKWRLLNYLCSVNTVLVVFQLEQLTSKTTRLVVYHFYIIKIDGVLEKSEDIYAIFLSFYLY